MLKLFFLSYFLVLSQLILGQSYKITYEQVRSGGGDRSVEELSKFLLERRKKGQQVTSILTFTNGNSSYIQDFSSYKNESLSAVTKSIQVTKSKLYKSQSTQTIIKD